MVDKNDDDNNFFPGKDGLVSIEDIGVGGPPVAAAPTSTRTAVAEALRAVLRTLPRDDPAAIRQSLRQSFQAQDVDGRTVYVWTRQPYFGVVGTPRDVSLLQARLMEEARRTHELVRPLIEGLEPLAEEADEEEAEAARTVVLTQLDTLVEELSREDEPIPERVETIFYSLIGSRPPKPPLEVDSGKQVGGQLERLREAFSINRAEVDTQEEDEMVIAYDTISEKTLSLWWSWRGFVREREDYFSTHRFLLARAITLVDEAAVTLESTLDQVGLTAPRRRSVYLDPRRAGGGPEGEDSFRRLSLHEYLSVVHRVVGDAEALLGSKKAVMAGLGPDLQWLSREADRRRLTHPAAARWNVKAAWKDLREAVDEAFRIARALAEGEGPPAAAAPDVVDLPRPDDKVEVYRGGKNLWYWRRLGPNGQQLSRSSQGYRDHGYTTRMAADLNPGATIEEVPPG